MQVAYELSDAQMSSLDRYVGALPNQGRWKDSSAYLDWAFAQILSGPLSMFPLPGVQEKLDQAAALQQEAAASQAPQRVDAGKQA